MKAAPPLIPQDGDQPGEIPLESLSPTCSISSSQAVISDRVEICSNEETLENLSTWIFRSIDSSFTCRGQEVLLVHIGNNQDFNYQVRVVPQSDSQPNSIISTVIDISLVDEVPFSEPVQLCFSTLQEATPGSCLSYLNERQQPPQWECEDECLQSNPSGMYCGETDHFTNFAILLGSVSNWEEDPCQSPQFITGSWGGDLILVGCVAGLIAIICIAIVLLSTTIKPFDTFFIRGKEGTRVANLRTIQRIQAGHMPSQPNIINSSTMVAAL
jgi:hypothetical protein